jgi:non-ribosomal peptide synthetase component F
LESSSTDPLRAFWVDELSGLPSLPPLGDRRSSTSSVAATCYEMAIDQSDVEAIRAVSRRFRMTVATTMLAALAMAMLSEYGVADVAVGVPISDRRSEEHESIVGLFVNLLLIRLRIDRRMTEEQALTEVRRALWRAYDHRTFPYGRLLDILDHAASPLCRVVFDFIGGHASRAIPAHGVIAPKGHMIRRTSVADFSLHVREQESRLLCAFVYQVDRFSASGIKAFADAYRRALRSCQTASASQTCALSSRA